MDKKQTNVGCHKSFSITMKETFFIWWPWLWQGLAGAIMASILLVYTGKIIFEAIGLNIIEKTSWASLICLFGIYIFTFIWTLKRILSKHYGHHSMSFAKNIDNKIELFNIDFKISSLIFWAWVWRFIPMTAIIFIVQFQLGFYKFYVSSGTRVPAQSGKSVSFEQFRFYIFSLESTPGNLIILLASVWSLKMAIEKCYKNYSIILK